jgi:hypothetical protein
VPELVSHVLVKEPNVPTPIPPDTEFVQLDPDQLPEQTFVTCGLPFSIRICEYQPSPQGLEIGYVLVPHSTCPDTVVVSNLAIAVNEVPAVSRSVMKSS